MAYFFDKIKTKTLSGQDQTLQFNLNNRPSFSIGATNYGSIVTTLGPAFTFSQDVSFNNIINSYNSMFVDGNGISFLQGDTTNSLKMNGNNIITGGGNITTSFGRINNLFISSPQNRSVTFNANLAVGTGSGSGTVTITSDTSSARVFTLGRSLTIEAGSLNTIAYNKSTTSLGAVPSPTIDGIFTLSQTRSGTSVSAPTWLKNGYNNSYTSGINSIRVFARDANLSGVFYVDIQDEYPDFIKDVVGNTSNYSETGTTLKTITWTKGPVKVNGWLADTSSLNPTAGTNANSATFEYNNYWLLNKIEYPVTFNDKQTAKITLNNITAILGTSWVGKYVNFGTLGADSSTPRESKFYQLDPNTTAVSVEILIDYTDIGGALQFTKAVHNFVWHKNNQLNSGVNKNRNIDVELMIPIPLRLNQKQNWQDINSYLRYPATIYKNWNRTTNEIEISTSWFNGKAANEEDFTDYYYGGMRFVISALN